MISFLLVFSGNFINTEIFPLALAIKIHFSLKIFGPPPISSPLFRAGGGGWSEGAGVNHEMGGPPPPKSVSVLAQSTACCLNTGMGGGGAAWCLYGACCTLL